MRIIILGLLSILLAACASTTGNSYQQTVQSWKGGNANKLMASWGTPDQRLNGPKGNYVLVYRTQTLRNYNTTASPSVGVSVAPDGRPILTTMPNINTTWNRNGSTSTCVAVFQTNAKGTIVYADSKGVGCYASANFENRMSNPDAKLS